MNALLDPPAAAPLRRAEWVVWGVVATAIAAVSIPTHAAIYGIAVPLAFLLGLAQGGSILVAVLAPRTGAAVHVATLPAIAALSSAEQGPWPVPVLGIIALAGAIVAIVLRGSWLLGAIAWVVSFALLVPVVVGVEVSGRETGAWAADLIVAASVALVALVGAAIVAQLLRTRAQLGVARRETELEHGRRLWAEERSRIAREMHDVVAHSMSLVHMRASSARYRLPGLGEEAAEEFDGIAAQARTALAEMRGLLGVLREGDDALTAPQPGLADLPGLVARAREAGVVVVELLERVEPPPAEAVQLALYRVAQEAVSNVVRHAPGASAAVELAVVAGEIELRVRNSAPARDAAEAPAAPHAGDGHGIRGMIERMTLVGGLLEHGPAPDGGYLVVARVPHPGEEAP